MSDRQVVSEATVLAHAGGFVEAAREFRTLATTLMEALATALGVPIDAFADAYFRLKILDAQYDAHLDDHWHYWFHGLECRFTHSMTGQKLEVRLGFVTEDGPEFGVLDPFFFHECLSSTPAYQHLAALLPDAFHDTDRAFDILEQHSFLNRITSESRWGHVARK